MNVVPDNYDDDVFEGEAQLRGAFGRSLKTVPVMNVDQLITQSEERMVEPKRRARFTRRSLLAMSGAVACSLAGFSMVWLRPATSFAEVQARVDATKSVRYDVRPLRERATDDLRQAKNILKEGEDFRRKTKEKLETAEGDERKELEDQLKEVEKLLKQAEEYLRQRGDKAPVSKYFVLGRYRQRLERKTLWGDLVRVLNRRTGKSLHINLESKIATVYTDQITIDREGNRTETKIKHEPDLTVDFYSKIRNVPESAKKLSETKTINGRKHIGFEHSGVDRTYTWTRTYWVDAETKLPSQVDFRSRSDDKLYAPSDSVMENIEFDVPLDESLFDTEVPEGYTVKKSKITGLE